MPLPLTAQERYDLGRKQRKQVRRAGHAGWTPKQRTESPLHLLEASIRGRVPSLIDLKNQRMAVSPFTYYRGAVPVMAYDLSLSPNTGIHAQLCGDAHVRNLGAYEGPDGRLVFDINDFDETLPGPFEWDAKRMATSLVLAGWDAGAKDAHCHEAATIFLQSYRRTILRLAGMTVLESTRYQVHRLRSVASMSTIFTLAERSTPTHSLLSLTEPVPHFAPKSEPKSKSKSKPGAKKPSLESANPPLLPRHPARIFKNTPPELTRVTGSTAQSVLDSLATYTDSLLPERRRFFSLYRPIDVAFKVVGTGSVGLRDYCVYMQGNGTKDPFFLQIKEEAVSAYAPYLGAIPGVPAHQGRRVIEGERAMQFTSDPFLGWTSISGRDYIVRQLNDHKASVDITQLRGTGLLEYAAVCGELLARAHSRGGDPITLSGYIGTSSRFDDAITRFAITYAQQTEADWKHFVRDHKAASKPKPEPTPNTTPKSKAKSKPKPKSKT